MGLVQQVASILCQPSVDDNRALGIWGSAGTKDLVRVSGTDVLDGMGKFIFSSYSQQSIQPVSELYPVRPTGIITPSVLRWHTIMAITGSRL